MKRAIETDDSLKLFTIIYGEPNRLDCGFKNLGPPPVFWAKSKVDLMQGLLNSEQYGDLVGAAPTSFDEIKTEYEEGEKSHRDLVEEWVSALDFYFDSDYCYIIMELDVEGAPKFPSQVCDEMETKKNEKKTKTQLA